MSRDSPRPDADRQTWPQEALSIAERDALRHPSERRVAAVVGLIGVFLVGTVVVLLLWSAEWLEAHATFARYESHARLLLLAVLSAPVVASWIRRRRWILTQEDSICVDATQLPRLHRLLASYCRRVDLPLPELYVSDAIAETTSFAWRGHQCIILSTEEFAHFSHAFEEKVEFALAREVGRIALGHTSFLNELLKSFVAPVPFLRSPLEHIRTYSCDRYGARLAPRALRALLVTVSGDPLVGELNLDAYFERLEAQAERDRLSKGLALLRKRVPFGRRVLQLRRAGLLAGPGTPPDKLSRPALE